MSNTFWRATTPTSSAPKDIGPWSILRPFYRYFHHWLTSRGSCATQSALNTRAYFRTYTCSWDRASRALSFHGAISIQLISLCYLSCSPPRKHWRPSVSSGLLWAMGCRCSSKQWSPIYNLWPTMCGKASNHLLMTTSMSYHVYQRFECWHWNQPAIIGIKNIQNGIYRNR